MKKKDKNTFNTSSNHAILDHWDEYACIQGCKANNLRYQEILYKKFYTEMRMMINRYTKDYQEGSIMLNNGFLRVFKKIHLYKYPGQLQAWIKQIMIHAISDYYRYKKKIPHVEINVDDRSLATTTIQIDYDYNVLIKALDVLPKTTRVVVNLYIIEEYTHKEIAQLLNISEGTSKWHLSEGRKLLHNQLNQYR